MMALNLSFSAVIILSKIISIYSGTTKSEELATKHEWAVNATITAKCKEDDSEDDTDMHALNHNVKVSEFDIDLRGNSFEGNTDGDIINVAVTQGIVAAALERNGLSFDKIDILRLQSISFEVQGNNSQNSKVTLVIREQIVYEKGAHYLEYKLSHPEGNVMFSKNGAYGSPEHPVTTVNRKGQEAYLVKLDDGTSYVYYEVSKGGKSVKISRSDATIYGPYTLLPYSATALKAAIAKHLGSIPKTNHPAIIPEGTPKGESPAGK